MHVQKHAHKCPHGHGVPGQHAHPWHGHFLPWPFLDTKKICNHNATLPKASLSVCPTRAAGVITDLWGGW